MILYPSWLTPLVRLEDHGGNWQRYIDAVYAIFYRDFIIPPYPQFRGNHVCIGRQMIDGKERTFWHVISTGNVEQQRIPDLRRCERIGWIRPIIEHEGDPAVLSWPNQRKGAPRQVLWVQQVDFVVILNKRPNCWWLWTAFITDREHTRKKFIKEYNNWLKSQRRP